MVALEVCVDSPEGLARAIEGGADRIELCAALALGGLTPSPGFMKLAAAAPVPVYAMIRPREGHFQFTTDEVEVMRRDIAAARRAGLAGVVLGAATGQQRLDVPLLAELMEQAKGMGTTLHRVVDTLRDPFAALEDAIALGFERILTSGGRPTAIEGAATIAALTRLSAGRIGIMAGSGVRSDNALALLRRTGADELHSSCTIAARLPAEDDPAIRAGEARQVDRQELAALKSLVSSYERAPRMPTLRASSVGH